MTKNESWYNKIPYLEDDIEELQSTTDNKQS